MNQNYEQDPTLAPPQYREHGGTKTSGWNEGIYIGPQLEDDQFTIDGKTGGTCGFKKNMPFNEGDVIEIDKKHTK